MGTLLAILQGAWHKRVSASTGWPGLSILWLGEKAYNYLICNFYLKVAAGNSVKVDLSLRYILRIAGALSNHDTTKNHAYTPSDIFNAYVIQPPKCAGIPCVT